MITINKYDELKQAFESHSKCLVKIGTPWCGPCKMVQERIENIEKHHSDICFINVNADDVDDEILDEFQVRNVPVVLFVENGEVVSRRTGLLSESDLEDTLK